VLLSGGVDSTACVAYHLSRNSPVSAVFIDYGQSAAISEYRAAKAVSAHYKINLTKISISSRKKYGAGVIPGRNAFLLMLALMAFEGLGGLISIGVHSGTEYVDCSQHFIEHSQRIFDMYADGKIQISAPFLLWSKLDIWTYCKEANVPLELTYSCELGQVPPCAMCQSCMDITRLNGS
jgi:7-cyano-7-deazaguanine synthase